ncbi:MAG: hypothetical protein K2X90_00260 [Candidatus Babeliaceae bacterium]|nr:hypothetical protein [Candidatus Babeliaceae bacterium]
MFKKLLFLSAGIITPMIFSYGPDCVSETDYVMQFLKDSTTVFTGSDSWKKDIKRDFSEVRTVFARIHNSTNLQLLGGVAARMYHIIHNIPGARFVADGQYASGSFSMSHIVDYINITSSITDSEVTTFDMSELTDDFKKEIQSQHGKETTLSDADTRCVHTVNVSFNENNGRLEQKLTSNCKTTLKFDEFIKKLNESKQPHNG